MSGTLTKILTNGSSNRNTQHSFYSKRWHIMNLMVIHGLLEYWIFFFALLALASNMRMPLELPASTW